jgi:hypothetical protein
MRLIMYNPRFPTHSIVPPELDILPASAQPLQPHHTHSNSNRNGHGTAHSTIYRVSANGIHVNHTNSSTSRVAGNDVNRSRSLSSNSSAGTVHARRKNSNAEANVAYNQGVAIGADEGEDGRRTPTQSRTMAQARGADVGQLDPNGACSTSRCFAVLRLCDSRFGNINA